MQEFNNIHLLTRHINKGVFMETRYIVYLVFFNWAWIATIAVNRLENPHTSVSTDLAYAGLCVGFQLWIVLCLNVPKWISVFKRS